MDLKLQGKKAFISGSTQGIGLAIAYQLLQEGVDVILNGRSFDKTERVKSKLVEQFPNSKIAARVADFSVKKEVDKLLSSLNDIDILINNVGIFEERKFIETSDQDWYDYFEINVMSGIRLSRKLLPHMLEKKWGRIVFISSESGVNVPKDMIHYGMSKAAMAAVSNGLSKLTKGTEVTVNTVLGGPTYSDGVAKVIQEIAEAQNMEINQLKRAIIQQTNPHILLQRFIAPQEIANLVTYLASPLSLATNGASLRADSGVLKTI